MLVYCNYERTAANLTLRNQILWEKTELLFLVLRQILSVMQYADRQIFWIDITIERL